MAKNIKELAYGSIVINSLVFLIFLLAPTHFFWHWDPEWSYWAGVQMEPWIPKVFATHFLIAGLWVVTIFLAFREKNRNFAGLRSGRPILDPHFGLFNQSSQYQFLKFSALWVGVGIWTSLVSLVPLANLSVWVQATLGPLSLVAWLWFQRKNLPWRWIELGTILGIAIQALLAWWQVFFQQALGGYWLLGQPHFRSSSIAYSSMPGAMQALPYGSTPHPNVLAAWLVLGMIICFSKYATQTAFMWVALLFFAPLVWTESIAAWITLVLIGLIWLARKYTPAFLNAEWKVGGIHAALASVLLGGVLLANLLLPYAEVPTGISRRAEFLQAVPRLLSDRPQGWGLLQHPLGYTGPQKARLGPVSRQPVHSAPISAMIDLGIWVTFLIIVFIILEHKKYSKILRYFLPATAFLYLDHWIYSTISGQFLIITLLVILHRNSIDLESHKT